MVDQYAMAVKKDSCITVGLPQKIAVLNKEVRLLTATATELQATNNILQI